jgi:hypothetical protein
LEAREKEKGETRDESETKGDKNTEMGNADAINKRKLQRERKRTRRQAALGDLEPQSNDTDHQEEEDPL